MHGTDAWKIRRRALAILLRDPRKFGALLRLRFGRVVPDPRHAPPPRVVALRLSEACNLRCRMCQYWGDEGRLRSSPESLIPRAIDTDAVARLIDDLAPFRPYLYFTGGEPLLLPDLGPLLAHAARRGLPTGLSTNATRLAERADELVAGGLDYLYASLDEPPGGRGEVRRMPDEGDSRAAATEGIRRLLERRDRSAAGLPIVQVQTVIVAENAGRLREMAAFLATSLKPDVWGIQPAIFTTPERHREATEAWRARHGSSPRHWAGFIRDHSGIDVARLDRDLAWLAGRRLPFRLRLYPPIGWPGFSAARWFGDPALPPADPSTRCLNPWLFAQVQPDGGVACCGSQPDATIGNVRDGRFLDLWRGEAARRLRETVSGGLFPTCGRCFARFLYHAFDGADA